MDFDKFCDEIMNLDSKIRYTAVLNRNGEKISGGYKKGISTLLNEEEQKMEMYHAGQRCESRKKLVHKIGKAKYSLTEYEKIKRMTFPINENHLLLLATEIDIDSQKIIEGVLPQISKINSEN